MCILHLKKCGKFENGFKCIQGGKLGANSKLKGQFSTRKSSQTPKIISALRGLKVGTVFGSSGDCVAPNSPKFLQIIPQPAGRLTNSTVEHEKLSSGLKLPLGLQQPLCNAIGSDKSIHLYHTYILVIFFHPMQQRKVAKQYKWHLIM